jgi:hypothetical protein
VLLLRRILFEGGCECEVLDMGSARTPTLPPQALLPATEPTAHILYTISLR